MPKRKEHPLKSLTKANLKCVGIVVAEHTAREYVANGLEELEQYLIKWAHFAQYLDEAKR